MNRAFVGYLKQFALLVLGEVPSEGDLDFNSIDHPDLGIALSTIFSVDSRVGQADLYSLKRPLFPLSIHSNSHTGTRSQRGQEQLVRVGGPHHCRRNRSVRLPEAREGRRICSGHISKVPNVRTHFCSWPHPSIWQWGLDSPHERRMPSRWIAIKSHKRTFSFQDTSRIPILPTIRTSRVDSP